MLTPDGEVAGARITFAPFRLLQQVLSSVAPWRFALIAFAFPLAVRIVPEVLAGPWPLGFDTVWIYAPFVREVGSVGLGAALSTVVTFYHFPPLLFFLLGGAATVSGAEPFTLTKAAAPLLYGFLGFSMYHFARRGLGWDQRKSLVLVLIATLYFLPLRFSWDMYKNTLGLAFFFLALAYFNPSSKASEKGLLIAFSALSVLSSELTAFLLGATAGVLFVWTRIRDHRWDGTTIALAATGAVATLFYLHLLVPLMPPATPLGPPPTQPGPLFNYVGAAQDIYVYPTLVDVYLTVLVLTVVLFAPILPLAVLGFFRERRLVAASIVLGVGSFSLIISPFLALPLWHRWLFMLVFPALFFVTVGLLKVRRRYQVAFLAVLLTLSVSFMAFPQGAALPYFTSAYTPSYVPSSLLQNTVPLQDSPDVVRAATWINDQLVPGTAVVAHIRFVGWAQLYIDSREVYGFMERVQVDNANFSRYDHVYLIDWVVGEGGFQADLFPPGAIEQFRSGRIAVYEIPR